LVQFDPDVSFLECLVRVGHLSALIIDFSVGLPLDYRNTSTILKLSSDARLYMAPFTLGDFSRKQYAHADPEHGRATFLTYASVLEALEKAKAEKSLMFQLHETYVLLALVEDAENNPYQSHAYMTKGRYWNSAGGGRDYSKSEMNAALKRFDALK
jgi:hypothetical protein